MIEYFIRKYPSGYEIWSLVEGPSMLGNLQKFQNFVGYWADEDDALAALEKLRNMAAKNPADKKED